MAKRAAPASGSPKGKKSVDWDKYSSRADKAWEQALKTPPKKGGRRIAELEDGQYVGQVSVITLGKTKDDIPWFDIAAVITLGPHKGTQVSRRDFLFGKDRDGVQNDAERLAQLIEQLEGCGLDRKKLKFKTLPAAAASLNQSKPVVKIGVSNWGTPDKPGQSIYFNGLAPDAGDSDSGDDDSEDD